MDAVWYGSFATLLKVLSMPVLMMHHLIISFRESHNVSYIIILRAVISLGFPVKDFTNEKKVSTKLLIHFPIYIKTTL